MNEEPSDRTTPRHEPGPGPRHRIARRRALGPMIAGATLALLALGVGVALSGDGPAPADGDQGEALIRDAREAGYAFPPEFAPQESIWMAWPTYENKEGVPTEPLTMELIEAVAPYVKVDLLAQDDEEIEAIRERLDGAGVPYDHVRFHPVPHADVWLRDMGPIFLVGDDGGLAVADFGFNMWGYEDRSSPASRAEEAIDRVVAERLGLPVIETDLISEGGNREFNGEGTLMMTEAVTRQRNPGWTLEEIEAELKRVLGQEKIIWLEEGMAEDDLTFRGPLPGDVFTVITTGGHIDEFARFVDPHTILLAEVTEEERRSDPIAAISHERLETNLRILEDAVDQDGHPFRIVRMPVPDPIFETMSAGDGVFDYIQPLEYEDGTVIEPDDEITGVMASSYLNFHITTGAVLMQTYWKPGRSESMRRKDREARRILQEVFPEREILAFHPDAVNLGGGGIHCIIQQQPATPDGSGATVAISPTHGDGPRTWNTPGR